MTGDIEAQASMGYKVSTFINLKTKKRERQKEKRIENLKHICVGNGHKIPNAGLFVKREVWQGGVNACY